MIMTLAIVAVGVILVGAVVGAVAVQRRGRDRPTDVVESAPEVSLGVLRLVAALNACEDAIVVVDGDGIEVLRNDAAEPYRQPRAGDALVAATIDHLLVRARQGSTVVDEVALFGPPSSVVSIKAEPLVIGSDTVGAMATVRDVSLTRRTDQVRRDFVANVSHELKTPIGALTVLAETMAVADDAAVQQQLADRVVREADRLAQIVEDLLDLSSLEAQEAPTRELVPVALIVGDAIDAVRPKADAGGIPILTTTLTADAALQCDRRQLTSAVTNVLDNAVKYSDRGGIVEVSVLERDASVYIAVRDHGVGIPARDLERIFERFYRVDRARSRATGGTGLGLAIVRHAVQAHGGEVSVESVEGLGSEFTLRIPQAGIAGTAIVQREGHAS